MDPRFGPIFQRQLRVFHAMQTDGEPPKWEKRSLIEISRRSMFMVDEALDAAGTAIGPQHSLRADARLLLALNLQQLVAMPLLLSQEEEGLTSPSAGSIQETVVRDAVTIARAAKDQARERRSDGRELSSADILRGLSNVMEDLQLSQWRLWDRNE